MELKENYNSDYDDVYIVPAMENGKSDVNHRGDVNLLQNIYFGRNKVHNMIPIFSSPMKGISGVDLVIEMANLDCMGILHRFDTPENRVKSIHTVSKKTKQFGVAIGINNLPVELDIAMCAYENGASLICVDTANGYNSVLSTIGITLRSLFGKDEIGLMAGNVVTSQGASFLFDCGYNFVRVGIGGGSLCTTRKVTGIGRNQLKALEDCQINTNGYKIVSDGGISDSGKAMKCFVAGAEMVMLGGMLALSNEAENNGAIYGMASKQNHIINNKEIKSIEGREIEINNNNKIPLKEMIDNFTWGLRSACTYLGVNELEHVYQQGRFEPVRYAKDEMRFNYEN